MVPDTTLSAFIAILPNLGVAIVFIAAWYQEKKERQELGRTLQETQTAHRQEILKILTQQFQIVANLHIPPAPS